MPTMQIVRLGQLRHGEHFVYHGERLVKWSATNILGDVMFRIGTMDGKIWGTLSGKTLVEWRAEKDEA